MSRAKTTRRQKIAQAIADRLLLIDGTGDWKSDFTGRVDTRMRFIDDVNDSPYLCVVPGSETREYQGKGFKWRFLEVTITLYVQGSDALDLQDMLEHALEDVESQLDSVKSIEYLEDQSTGSKQIVDLTVLSMTTDQGAFADDGLGIGEIVVEVRY